MFPQGEKRTTWMYNDLPIQISGPNQYGSHPDYSYLEGRKLDDVYPTGEQNTFGTTMRSAPGAPQPVQPAKMPAVLKKDRARGVGY